MILELPWEKDCKGNKAILKMQEKSKIIPALSKKIALLKMTDITLISGYFEENKLLFYPSVSVLFDSSDKLEFFGIYSRDLEENKIEDKFPIVCVRKCYWIRDMDFSSYKECSTVEEYIKKTLISDKNHVSSSNFFLKEKCASEILSLVETITNLIIKGISVKKIERKESEFEYVEYSVSNGFISYNFSYTPFQFKSEDLEKWSFKWRIAFARIETNIEFYPTKKFRVSYNSSILDYLIKFKPYFNNSIND